MINLKFNKNVIFYYLKINKCFSDFIYYVEKKFSLKIKKN